MQLWTDYEGVTIDGAFPLQKLLLPEGRSAFFSTAGPAGEPTVVRLIECHFDEQEILARWRSVEALNHPNFLKFERCGQIELDGGPVVYAVFEKVDANLAEVLDQGHLTVQDVAQLASSLVAALTVLHTHGFIHEHIEPRNIFAVCEVVKLRGDCIRETPEAEEGRAAKQRDVHDLATVLLQALTQRQSIEGVPDYALPPPFGQIIRNGLSGAWGLEKIRAALEEQFGSVPTTAPNPVNATSIHAVPATPAAPASPAAPATAAEFGQQAPNSALKPSIRPESQLPLPLFDKSQEAKNQEAKNHEAKKRDAERQKTEFAGPTTRRNPWGEEQRFSLRSRWVAAIGIFAVFVLLCTWGLAHAWNAHTHKAMQAAAPASPAAAQAAEQISARPAAAALPNAGFPRSSGAHPVWRVIAYTYDRRTDAEKKVSSLRRSHPDLQPEVFAPRGHAPYLVSIGGAMDRNAAYALARRSRSLGLPRDTYAQNYSH